MAYKRESNAEKLSFTCAVSKVFHPLQLRSIILIVVTLNFLSGCKQEATAKDDLSAQIKIKKARNETALLQAQENIEKFRKGDAQIRIIDAKGNAVSGARINIKQISHDFMFGCYLKIDDLSPDALPAYEKHFARLFNLAVVGTYWDFIESEQGKEDWLWFEREIALAQKLNLKIQAAPVLWGTNKSGTPDWLPQSKNEIVPILQKRVKSTVAKYKNAVDDWGIVNEPLAPKTDVFTQRIGLDYIEAAFLWAHETAPSERFMLNEYGIFGSVEKHNYNRDDYFKLLKTLIERGVSVDIIGIQSHANGEWFEPANIAEQLDRYATLGKPIQITEFSAQTLNYKDRRTPLHVLGNYQSGVWNAERQAEFYREFYTIAFGNPAVEAIIQWGLDDERAWLPGIGLIDASENPKPNYRILDRLINNEWRTNLQINLSPIDTVKFRGFYGSYEIEVIVNGRTTKTRFDLKRDDRNNWTVLV